MADMKREKKKGRLASLLRGNNGGDSLVLVVVVMLVVMLLGVAILYSSYTAVLLRSSQRKSEKTFTSAETGMDLIREGLSEINSDAVAAGYKALLSSFSNDQLANKATFADAYLSEIVNFGKADGGKFLFPEADTGPKGKVTPTKYSVAALDAFLKGRSKGDYSLKAVVDGSESDDTGSVYVTKDNDLILRGVRLRYKKNGYEEQITTDFRMSVPAASISSKYIGFNDALKDYNFIADQGLSIYRYGEAGRNPHSSTFEGSGYAGSATIGVGSITVNENQTLIIGRTREVTGIKDDGSVEVKKRGSEDSRTSGDITFINSDANESTASYYGGKIEVKKGATLWANNISLNKGSVLNTDDNSHIYIRNDLNFETGGTATLRGNYYGFGSGIDLYGKKSDSPLDSSSIIFNRKGTLDISGISSLTIAGKSFVTESSTSFAKHSGMGSSITTRSEQLAYLVPDSFFNTDESSTDDSYSNPRIIPASEDPTDESNKVENDKALKSISDSVFTKKNGFLPKPLSDYGIKSKSDIKVLTYNVPGNASQCVRYYFLSFNNQDDANKYFKDFFDNNKETVNSYIEGYASLIGFDQKGAAVRTDGTTIEGKSGSYRVTGGGKSSSDEAASYNDSYRKLSETLTTTSEGESTPFYSLIDVEKLHKLCTGKDGNKVSSPVTVTLNKHVYFDEQNKKDVVVQAFWGDLHIGSGSIVQTYGRDNYPAAPGYSNGCNAYVVDGNVRLSGNFAGIILCSGKLEIGQSDVKIENLGVKALKETDLWKGSHGSTDASETSKWRDVTYENWKKD